MEGRKEWGEALFQQGFNFQLHSSFPSVESLFLRVCVAYRLKKISLFCSLMFENLWSLFSN